MIKEGLKNFLESITYVYVPVAYNTIGTSFDLDTALGKDIGYRVKTIFFDNINSIITRSYGDTSYNTLGKNNATGMLWFINGKPINPSYGVLTASNTLSFYGNGTNQQESGDNVKIYNHSTGEYYGNFVISSSDSETLTFSPSLNSLDLNTTYLKVVNNEGSASGFVPIATGFISKYANDAYIPIIQSYLPKII